MKKLVPLMLLNSVLAFATVDALSASGGMYRNCCKKSVENDYYCCTNCCWSPTGPDECTSSTECNPTGGGGDGDPEDPQGLQ